MNASYRLILLLMLCSFINLVFAQYYKDPKGRDPLISSFHEKERSCQYRRQLGFCRRRSECSRPSSRVCRSGKDPIVCCLEMDQHEQKPIMKPDPVNDIDLSYPGCGYRSPKIQETSTEISNTGGRERDRLPVLSPGGYTAKKNSWPWMVKLHTVMNGEISKTSNCGASLISQNYVLTAAHCVNLNPDPSKFSIVVGAHSIKDGTAYPVRHILIHPGNKRGRFYHDIALIAVGKPVKLSEKVYPVCLPSGGLIDKIEMDNLNVTLTGWGRTSYDGRTSEKLQEVTIPIVPLKECNAAYSGRLKIIKQQICAGVPEERKGSCKGDSGGPLVLKLKDNFYVQLGIVSFGYKCLKFGHPTVYTKVSEYTKWIYDNTDLGKKSLKLSHYRSSEHGSYLIF